MATRRAERLITRIRRETGNTSYSSTNGLSQRDIAEFLTDAQDDILTAILSRRPRGFRVITTTLNVASGEETVALPDDMHYDGGIIKLEYSPTGSERDYRLLDPIDQREQSTSITGDPGAYTREDTNVVLTPVPQSTITNGLRLKYIKAYPRIDVRRGTVSAVTLNSGASSITSLTLTTGATLDDVGLLEDDYICVVDRDGLIKMQGIPISAVNSGTGVVTIVSGFTYDSGETIAVGDYVVSGKYASTHCQLPQSAERFLVAYAKREVQRDDSNDDSVAQTDALEKMREDIVDGFSDLDADLLGIPRIQ